MTPIETILTLQQLQKIYDIHQEFGKVIDEETKRCYNTCAFNAEIQSGSLRIYPRFVQERLGRI